MNTVIIDVREPYEFELGHAEGAINIPSASLMAGVPELKDVPKDDRLVVYCRSGSRSAIAIQIFKQMGFTNLVNGINLSHMRQKLGLH